MRMTAAAASAALAALAAAGAQEEAPSPDMPFLERLPPREDAYEPAALLESWGWLVGEQFDLRGLALDREEARAIARGLSAYAMGEEPPTDLDKSLEQIQEYLALRERRVFERRLEKNRAAEKAFFEELADEPEVRSLAAALRYEILEPGGGEKPAPEDWARVHYEGRLLDGTVFDSSYRRGEPSEFKLDEVIRGWTLGLPMIGEGGKIRLYLPASLGYGKYGKGSVPPGAALIFEVELLEVIGPENPNAAATESSSPAGR